MSTYASHHQPGPGFYPPAPPPRNGPGTAGFVLGLLGLLFSFIPVIGVVAWPLVLLGLVFAGIGLSRVRARRATNKGLTIAGLVCALVGLLMCILYTAAFGAAVSAPPTAPGVPAVQSGAAATTPTGIGDTTQDGAFAFTVTDVQSGLQTLGDGFLQSEAQGSYVLVHVTVTNVGTESAMFTSANQTLLDAQGREFSADAGAAVMNVPGSESFLTDINPGNSVDGVLVFDVPEGLSPTAIELHESMFSGGVTVSLTG